MQIKSATFGQLQNNCYLVTDEASGRSAWWIARNTATR